MYKFTPHDSLIRQSDNASIPNDPANSDYAQYLAWLAEGNAPLPVDPPTTAQLREIAKAVRTAAVAAITVTTSSGKTFDGDETSQTRMSRAIIGMQAAGVPTIGWTLADNTTASVTVAELTEAMILAGQQQAALWALP